MSLPLRSSLGAWSPHVAGELAPREQPSGMSGTGAGIRCAWSSVGWSPGYPCAKLPRARACLPPPFPDRSSFLYYCSPQNTYLHLDPCPRVFFWGAHTRISIVRIACPRILVWWPLHWLSAPWWLSHNSSPIPSKLEPGTSTPQPCEQVPSHSKP